MDGAVPAPFCAVIRDVDTFDTKRGTTLARFVLADGEYVAAAVTTPQVVGAAFADAPPAKDDVVRITQYTIRSTASGSGSVIYIIAMESVSAAVPIATSSSSSSSGPEAEDATPSPGPAQAPARPDFTPIADLHPGMGGYVLWVRVVAKAPPRSYSNNKGHGTLVTLTLMDETGQLDAIMFNECVDRFSPLIREGATYTIRGGTIQPARRQHCRSAVQLVFNYGTFVEESVNAGPRIPRMRYKFVDMTELRSVVDKTFVDVLAVVVAVGPIVETAKDGRTVTRRVITLADRDLRPIDLTLWDERAREYSGTVGAVVAVKDAQAAYYGEAVRLTSLGTTVLTHHPSFPKAAELKQWYDEQPKPLALAAVARGAADAPRCTLADVRGLGCGERADFRTVLVTLTRFASLDRDPWYYARRAGDRWEKCDAGLPGAEPRFVVSCVVVDSLGELFVSAFDAAAQALLGVGSMDEAQATSRDELYANACYKRHVLTLRLKVEERDGERRLRATVTAVEPVNYRKESGVLLERLQTIMPRLFAGAAPLPTATI